ncbi:tetracycline efflux MFS transporter Tet(Y), partial [Escherichia coli]
TGLTNITSIIGPVGFTTLYGLTAGQWDGWVWLVAASLYLIAIPLLRQSASLLRS